jgi:hypothetical protein
VLIITRGQARRASTSRWKSILQEKCKCGQPTGAVHKGGREISVSITSARYPGQDRQSAVAEVLGAIYEADFAGFSYGFQHSSQLPGKDRLLSRSALSAAIGR